MNIERTTPLSSSLPASSETRTARSRAVESLNTTSAQASTQVDISPEGQEQAKANGSSASSSNESSDEGNKSPLREAQSFIYGTLGLNRPDEVQKNVNASYTAGKWVAAAATAGMFVSLLV